MTAPMFVRPEDAARTASGALANPWTQIAGVALLHAVVQLALECAKAQLTAVQQSWSMGEHLRPAREAFNDKVAEHIARDAFADADPEQASGDADIERVRRLLEQIARHNPKGHRPE